MFAISRVEAIIALAISEYARKTECNLRSLRS